MTAAARFSAPSGETAPTVSSPSSRRLPSETTSRERRAVSRVAWPSSAVLTHPSLARATRERAAEGERKGAEDQDERAQPGPERREEAPWEAERDTPPRRAGEKERNEDDERCLSRRHGRSRHRSEEHT